jgi:hypothetical protein
MPPGLSKAVTEFDCGVSTPRSRLSRERGQIARFRGIGKRNLTLPDEVRRAVQIGAFLLDFGRRGSIAFHVNCGRPSEGPPPLRQLMGLSVVGSAIERLPQRSTTMTTATKLNDLQLILLSTASQRDRGNLLPLPESAADVPRARKAIQALLAKGLAAEAGTNQLDQVWREEGDQRLTVGITDSGRDALGLGDPDGKGEASPTEGDAEDAPPAPAKAQARAGSKKALLLELLRADGGASLDELTKATGWLPHTTRAAITGVRKAHDVTKLKVEGVTRYSMSGTAAQ